MEAVIIKGKKTERVITRNILGHNLELVLDGDAGFLNDRLYNGKFRGPEDQATGLAKGWETYPINDLKGMKLRLLSGMGMNGKEAQIIENYSSKKGFGIMQSGISVYDGEELEVSIWARIQNGPVTLHLGLKPMDMNCGMYASGTIEVSCPYWKEYRIALPTHDNDDNAVFICTLEGNGYVCIDQIHLSVKGGNIISQSAEEAIMELQPPALRFPGGCISTVYHWKNGTGPGYLRPAGHDPVFKEHVCYDFGTDEYLELCVRHNITPHITVNISTATPQDACQWAEYCRAWFIDRNMEPPAMYWQIGNEQHGSWEIGHMTAEMYSDVLQNYSPLIRMAYPGARIMAIGVENCDGFQMGESHPWRTIVLDRAGDQADIYIAHLYHAGGFNKDKSLQMTSNDTVCQYLKEMLEGIINDLDSRGFTDKKIGLTEWNMWYHAAHHDKKRFNERYDTQHILFASSVIHMLARLSPRIEVANFYNLINVMGLLLCKGNETRKSLLFEIFKKYGEVFPAERVETEIIISESSEKSIDVLCAEKNGKTDLFILNKSLDESFEIRLAEFGKLSVIGYYSSHGIEEEMFKETNYCLQGDCIHLSPLSWIHMAEISD